MKREPRWLDKQALILLQAESLAEHGGLEGLGDERLLDSALARPRNRWAYGRASDLAAIVAAYGVAIIRNHPFMDGNKRTAFLAVGLFLALNGRRLVADKAEAARIMWALAAGKLSEPGFAAWIRRHARKR